MFVNRIIGRPLNKRQVIFVYLFLVGMSIIVLFINLNSIIMKRVNVLLFCMVLVVIFSSGAAFSQSVTDYKSKIAMADKEFAKNMLDGNIEKSLSMYTADAISMPSYAPMSEGVPAIKMAAQEEMKKGMKYNTFELSTQKVIPNGNLITEIGTYKLNATVPGMDKPMDDHGKYLTIWEKQMDGSLKIKVLTWNSDVDPMDMMKAMSQK
jgi:ketosteroid isomerase-like protein